MHQSRAIRVLMQDGEIRTELKKKSGNVDSTRWVDSFYTAIIGDSVNILENLDKTGEILIPNSYKDFVSLGKHPGSINEKLSQEMCFQKYQLKYYYKYDNHEGCTDFPIPGLLLDEDSKTITQKCADGLMRVNENCVPKNSDLSNFIKDGNVYMTACVRENLKTESPLECTNKVCEDGYVEDKNNKQMCVLCEGSCDDRSSSPCFNKENKACG